MAHDAPLPPFKRRLNPMARLGAAVLLLMTIACIGTLPWTLSYYNRQYLTIHHQPPSVAPPTPTVDTGAEASGSAVAGANTPANLDEERAGSPAPPATAHAWLGTDNLGRSLLARCLLGGAISLAIGFSAAAISVFIGTSWGLIAGYAGGRVDSALMRIVDVLYGLPYILLVLLLVVAVEGMVSRVESGYIEQTKKADEKTAEGDEPDDDLRAARQAMAPRLEGWKKKQDEEQAAREAAEALEESDPLRDDRLREAERLDEQAADLDPRPWLTRFVGGQTWVINLLSLLVAIGVVSWLTLARVVRGQVLSLKNQPFVEAARAAGCGSTRILTRHLLPNLLGPIIVYTTLTVPQAILQESFLSFLGIGVRPPLPSWGNLAAEGLKELNPVESHWWLLLFPSLLLGLTLLSLNYLGDGLRDKHDPRSK